MTGRQETTIKIETRTKKVLENADPLIRDFYYSLGRKTASTKEMYVRHVVAFSEYFSGKDLKSLKQSDIGEYMEETKYTERGADKHEASASFLNVRLAAIKAFYKNLYKQGIIPSNPAANIEPISSPGLKDPVYMTDKEYRKIIKNIREDTPTDVRGSSKRKLMINRNVSIFMLGCVTGLRVTSITEINLNDVDFEEKSIRVVEKGNKARTVYFDDDTCESIKLWLEDRQKISSSSDALFLSQNGKRLNSHDISYMLSKYAVGINKKITPHKMRSTCATNLYKATGNIYRVQKTLGHANISNTMRYTGVDPAEQKESADILGKLYKSKK